MAITKKTTYLGFEFDNYVKIIGTYAMEAPTVGDDKDYEVTLFVSFYTDSTKEYPYDSVNYRLQGIKMTELALPTLYEKLKELPDFEGYKDC